MILTDTGPLVALLDVTDPYHDQGIAVLNYMSDESMLTTLPCLTEAMYMLGKSEGYTHQAALWSLWTSGRLVLHNHELQEINRMMALMEQYQDTSMDLADASLVATAEILSLRRVFSFDSDFYVYRLADGSALEVIR